MKTLLLACVVTMSVMCLAACESDGPGGTSFGAGLSSPSIVSFARASIAPRFNAFAGPSIFICPAPTAVVLPLDLVVTAIDTATVTQVTIRLPDGSNVGGPSVTFPRPDLRSQFGSTLVLAGTTRTFAFNPFFTCGLRPLTVAADLTFLVGGQTQRLTVSGSLP
jgi:hypothetical protein